MRNQVVVLGVAHPHIYQIARLVSQSPSLALAGVWAPDPDSASRAAERLSVPALATLEDVWALDPVLTLIGAEPRDRAGLAIASAENDAAAIVDKPLALDLDTLASIRLAVQRTGVPIITYYPVRGYPLVQAAIEAVRRGDIGGVVRISAGGSLKLNAGSRPTWHFTRDGNGGLLIDMGAHYFDLCRAIADAEATHVDALHANRTQPGHAEFQDVAQASMCFANEVIAEVQVDWLMPESAQKGDVHLAILGTAGRIEVRTGDTAYGKIWSASRASADLVAADNDADEWGIKLVQDIVSRRQAALTQDQVIAASDLSLRAFISATE